VKRKIFIFGLIILFIFGCQNFQIVTENENATVVLTKITAREIGCEVALIADAEISGQVDRSLRNFYILVKTGEVTEDAKNQLNETLRAYVVDRPTLVDNVMDLMELVDIQYTGNQIPEEVKEIMPKLFEAVEKGYIGGFSRCVILRE
jgi:regulator of protease activity HflC (stomatin/prohibitin superfamily)